MDMKEDGCEVMHNVIKVTSLHQLELQSTIVR